MKRFLKASTFLCVIVAMFAALLLKAGVAGAAGAPPFKRLNAVAAVSARNIWAVGDSFSGGVDQPLIEHWNGAQWSIVPAPDPNPGASTDTLESVTEVSARDVWAVGFFATSSGNELPLIEHWSGKQWSIVASARPPVGFPGGNLLGIEEVSAHNIWAVGTSFNSALGTSQTLIEHWNGKQWSIVPSPNPAGATSSSLGGVTEVSAHNIWAVGDSFSRATGIEQPLIEHWNGKHWSLVASPNTGSNTVSLTGVAEVSARNIWAVGPGSSFAEHWNGKHWHLVATPNPTGSVGSTLFGIGEVSAHDIWSVGYYIVSAGGRGIDHTLIEHWNGTMWSIIPSPNSGPTDNDFLFGVVAISAHDVWAVGTIITNGSNAGQPLIEHWDGVQWSIVPGAS